MREHDLHFRRDLAPDSMSPLGWGIRNLRPWINFGSSPMQGWLAGVFHAVLVCAISAATTSCSATHSAQSVATSPPPLVSTITVAAEPVTVTVELPGRTTSYLMSEVRPQVTGLVRTMLFREGTDVHAGQPLYQIESAPFQALYDGQKAALAHAEANAATVRLKAERYGELIKTNVVSRQDYNDVVALAGQGVADVAAAKAALESARINLANTRVNAPISGRVGPSTVTPGALVTADQSAALTTIQTLDPIYVDVTQSSAELLRLRREFGRRTTSEQAKVKLLLEDGSPYPLEGLLRLSDVTVDPTTGSVTLRAVFDNPEGLLLPGMFVRAVIPEAQVRSAVLIPRQAIVSDGLGETTTLVVGADSKVEVRHVVTRRTISGKSLITEGLNEGDRVIVDSAQNINAGMLVRPTETGLASAPTVGTAPP